MPLAPPVTMTVLPDSCIQAATLANIDGLQCVLVGCSEAHLWAWSWPGLSPQVGFTRLAAVSNAQAGFTRLAAVSNAQVGFTRLAAVSNAEVGQARLPMPSTSSCSSIRKDVDARQARA